MKAVVDRIEGDFAILLLGDEEYKVNMPLKYLPERVSESDILHINFRIDHEATEKQKKKVIDLLNKLTNTFQGP
jgi:hypothetical protein